MYELPKFDELVKLAQHNPEALENLRQQHINFIIDKAEPTHQKRLRGLQFQIDAQRSIHANSPMGSCVKISKMMQESFTEMRGWLNQISGFNDPLRSLSEENQNKEITATNIIAFPSHS